MENPSLEADNFSKSGNKGNEIVIKDIRVNDESLARLTFLADINPTAEFLITTSDTFHVLPGASLPPTGFRFIYRITASSTLQRIDKTKFLVTHQNTL